MLHGLVLVRMPRLAVCLHGKAAGGASPTHLERFPFCKTDPRHQYNQSLEAHVRLAHQSVWKYVVEANRAARNVEVEVFLHSWTPEAAALLDELYQPSASQHEPALRGIDKVRSQHLSLKRCVALVPRRFDLVLASRYDLVFVTPLLIHQLTGWRDGASAVSLHGSSSGSGRAARSMPKLWLPHNCQALFGVNATVARATQAACGCTDAKCHRHREVGRGMLVTAPYTTRYTTEPRIKAALSGTPANFLSWVLDYWFIATREAAESFGAIYDRFGAYKQRLQVLGGNIKNLFPEWAHFFWAVHVHHHFRPDEVRFGPLLAGQDFLLARRWWLGTTCKVAADELLPADRRMVAAAVQARATPSSTWRPHASFMQTPSGERERGAGGGAAKSAGSRRIRSPLVDQCPASLRQGDAVICASHHPACRRVSDEHSRRAQEMLSVGKRLMKGISTSMRCFSA